MKKLERLGERHPTNEGCWTVIIEYFSKRNCTVQLEDGTVLKNIAYDRIQKGQIKNPNFPSVYGVGHIGIGKYVTWINGKSKKYYSVWRDMLGRCYSEKSLEKRPTYKDVGVCEEWHCFQNFAKWFEDNYKEGFELDKDILIKGNKTYSSKTCTFIPQEINKLFIISNKNRGKYPMGVSKVKGGFLAKHKKHIGIFNTVEEAFQVYKIAKELHIKEVADKWRGQITEPCYEAMYNYKVEITD